MAKTAFTMVGQWDKLRVSLDPGMFQSRERAAIRQATKQNGAYVRMMIKKSIHKSWTQNALFTRRIKGSSKTLFDFGDLHGAITYKVINWDSVFVGVMKQAKAKSGAKLANVTEAIHDGATINVTPKMRSMFWYLYMVSIGKMPESKLTGRAKSIWERWRGKTIIKPLRASTTTIRIPKRPFMRKVFESRTVKSWVKQNWVRAIDRALKA